MWAGRAGSDTGGVDGQTDREIWVSLYAAQLVDGDELVTEIHTAEAEQAWAEAMTKIAAMENSADDGAVDGRG